MKDTWEPDSWQRREAAQQPRYDDPEALDGVLGRLSQLPPLVTSWEVEGLKRQLGEAARGEAFLLQGGDCCERFEECNSEIIVSKLKILLQMSLILLHGCRRRVVRVGRFGGQYAKPRSSDTETRDGVTLPSYRGDLINGPEFTAAARRPDPERLVRGYGKAAMTLNFIRALGTGGFADLHHPQQWDLAFASHSQQESLYQATVGSIVESIQFVETLAGRPVHELTAAEFYTSQLWSRAGAQARAYLKERSIPQETAERFGLGWAEESWDGLLGHLGRQGIAPAKLAQAVEEPAFFEDSRLRGVQVLGLLIGG